MITSSRNNRLCDYARELVRKASEEVGRKPEPEVLVVSFCSLSHDYQLTDAAIIKKVDEKYRAEVVLYTPSSLGYRYNGEFIRRNFRTRVGDRHLIYVGTIPAEHKGWSIRLKDIERPEVFTVKRKRYIDIDMQENGHFIFDGDGKNVATLVNGKEKMSEEKHQSPGDYLTGLEVMSSMASMPCEMKCIYIPSTLDIKRISDEYQMEDIPVCFLRGGVDWFLRLFECVHKLGDTNENLWDQKTKQYDRFHLEPSALYQWSDCESDCHRHISYERAVVRFLLFVSHHNVKLKEWMIKSICAVTYRRLYIRMQHARRLDLDTTLEYYVIHLNNLAGEGNLKENPLPRSGNSFCTQLAWRMNSTLKKMLDLGDKLCPIDFKKEKEVLSVVFETFLRLESLGITN